MNTSAKGLLLASSLLLSYAAVAQDQASVPSAPPSTSIEYTRLIPDKQPMPPVGPTLSGRGAVASSIVLLISKAGPWYNESKVRSKLSEALADDMKRGSELMKRSGQSGMLLKVQVVTQVTGGGHDYYSLRGDGVVLIGVGPDANSVCYFARCFNVVEPALPVGGKLAAESGYLWIEPSNSKSQVSMYDIGAMESRAATIAADSAGAAQAYSVARTVAIEAFTQAARAAATSERDRKLLASLAQERADSRKQLAKIEEDLAAELRRQERIARTSATLNAIAAVLSLSSAVANATVSVGEDVTKASPNGITDKASLAEALNTLLADSKAKIIFLENRRTSLNTSLGSVETNITKLGVAVGLDPRASPVLSSPLTP
ncbi:hypothetical protein J2W34_006333 [Variovorax boronicumulans]|uniref:hypothetical protein n=1 Tax=Variovorax boronicumulans TaxID=436515 RepID=UPI00278298AD|nr:hypothetical protein [Variovorax boronicumulans]MDQ0074509.1 hypothetical protein [Variovorax boronicumulans]